VDYYYWLVWCERKIVFWLEDTVHVNSARVRGLASTSQPAELTYPKPKIQAII